MEDIKDDGDEDWPNLCVLRILQERMKSSNTHTLGQWMYRRAFKRGTDTGMQLFIHVRATFYTYTHHQIG